jgi:hypothetical protein
MLKPIVTVLEALKACDMSHFAGQGQTNSSKPLQNAVMMIEKKKKPILPHPPCLTRILAVDGRSLHTCQLLGLDATEA